MNAKISVFVICVKAIMQYLLMYNLHDCTFDVKVNKFRPKRNAAIIAKLKTQKDIRNKKYSEKFTVLFDPKEVK